MSITAQPEDITVAEGEISEELSVTAVADGAELSYQWYKAADAAGNDAVKVKGANAASLTLDTSLTAGEYHYFVKITVDGIGTVLSDVATVTVE